MQRLQVSYPSGVWPGLEGIVRAQRPANPPQSQLRCQRLADRCPLRLSYQWGHCGILGLAGTLRAVWRFQKLPRGLVPASWASLGARSGQIPRTQLPHAPCTEVAHHERVAGVFNDVKCLDQCLARHENAINVCYCHHVNVRSGVLVI